MKKIIGLLILTLITLTSFGRGWYFSNAGNDISGNGTVGTPYATIAKANSLTLTAGDIILFNSGDTFIGTITPQTSGITYSSYNSGAKPIISGLTTISSWVPIGGNIWEAVVTGGLSTCNVLVKNGVVIPMGRYPTSGYRTYTSFSGTTSITDAALTGTPNWTGAEVIIRAQDWGIVRGAITNHTGTTITYTSNNGLGPKASMGYFIQNSLAACDSTSEWYYSDSSGTKLLKMYSVINPGTVQVSTLTNLVSMIYANTGVAKNNILFKELNFQGSEGSIFNCKNSKNITIDSCVISYSGQDGVSWGYMTNFAITNNYISDINNIGLFETNPSYGDTVNIKYNTFKRINMSPGLTSASNVYNGGDGGNGILAYSPNLTIYGNTFDSTGYCGITLRANRINTIVRRNIISNFCFVKNDGGGIYNVGQRTAAGVTGVYIDSNIIYNSRDATVGTALSNNQHVRGIYLDATSDSVNVLNNTIFDCWGGIYMSSARYCKVQFNTVFNAGQYLPGLNTYEGLMTVAGGLSAYPLGTKYNNISNNIFFNKFTDVQLNVYVQDTTNNSDSIGIIDYNSYINTNTNVRLLTNNFNVSPFFTYRTLSQWQAVHPQYDIHSNVAPVTTPTLTSANWNTYLDFRYNNTNTARKEYFIGLSKKDARNISYNDSLILNAWSSIALINNGTSIGNAFPIANAGIDQSTTLPSNNVTLHGTGTDSDGSVVGYSWTKISGNIGDIILHPNTDTTTIAFTQAGTYQYLLTVTDNLGAVGKDTIQIVINPAPLVPPTVNSGVDQTIQLPTATTFLSGATTGNISLYQWTVLSSSPVGSVLSSPTSISTTISSLVQGVYKIELRVTDFNTLIARDTVQITVLAPPVNIPPTANAGIDKGFRLPINNVNVTGTGADVDGTVIAYNWSQVSGPNSATIVTAGSISTTITNLIQGTYIIKFTVTDNNGAIGTDLMQIIVDAAIPPPNIPPVAFTDGNKNITLPVNIATLIGTGTDADGTVISYSWTKQSGPATGTISSPSSATTGLIGLVQGTYIFRLKVVDNSGDSAIAVSQVVVNPVPVNTPPVVNAGASKNFYLPTTSTSLSGTASDAEGGVLTYLWKQTAGPVSTPITGSTTLTPSISGMTVSAKYVYQLTVTDDHGNIGTSTIQINVYSKSCNCIINRRIKIIN